MTEAQRYRMALHEVIRLIRLHPGGMARKILDVAEAALQWPDEPRQLTTTTQEQQ